MPKAAGFETRIFQLWGQYLTASSKL